MAGRLDPADALPSELAVLVLSFLAPRDLLHAAQVSRRWRALADDFMLWKTLCREKWHTKSPGMATKWKALYWNWFRGLCSTTTMPRGEGNHVSQVYNLIVDGSNPNAQLTTLSTDGTLKMWRLSDAPGFQDHSISFSRFINIGAQERETQSLAGRSLVKRGAVYDSRLLAVALNNAATDKYPMYSILIIRWADPANETLLLGHTLDITCMHMDKGSDTLVSGSLDSSVRVWDIPSASCKFTFSQHEKWVADIAYVARTNTVMSAAWDGSVFIWDATTGTTRTLPGHEKGVTCMMLVEDQNTYATGTEEDKGFVGMLLTGSEDETIQVWHVAKEENDTHLERFWCVLETGFPVLGMTRNDSSIFVSHPHGRITVCDLATWTVSGSMLPPAPTTVTCVSADDIRVVAGYADGLVRVWDLKTLKPLHALRCSFSGAVSSVAFDETRVYAGCMDGTVKIFDYTVVRHGARLATVVTHKPWVTVERCVRATALLVTLACVVRAYTRRSVPLPMGHGTGISFKGA